MSNTIAQWSCSLDCECPKCGEYIDLLEYEEFWHGNDVEALQNRYGVDAVCPKCDHEFQVDTQW